jgi:hypothetical protein
MSKILFHPTDKNGEWVHHAIEEDDDGRIRITDASDDYGWLDFTRAIVIEEDDDRFCIVPITHPDGTENATTVMAFSRAFALASMFDWEIRTGDGIRYAVARIEDPMPKALVAANLACGLMAGDPETFKAGYSKENAILCAIDYMDKVEGNPLSPEDVETLRYIMDERDK